MRIGILGGSFSPVHRGHLHLAAQARARLGLDRVYFVPTRLTPGKPASRLLPQTLRLRLLRAALRPHRAFRLSTCELRRKGLSYTVDTLRYFRRRLGKRAVLYLLLGDDAASGFGRWKSPRRILGMCRLVAATRPGARSPELPPGAIRLVMEPVDVSASRIRERLERSQNVAALVPAGTAGILARWAGRRKHKETRSSRSATARSS